MRVFSKYSCIKHAQFGMMRCFLFGTCLAKTIRFCQTCSTFLTFTNFWVLIYRKLLKNAMFCEFGTRYFSFWLWKTNLLTFCFQQMVTASLNESLPRILNLWIVGLVVRSVSEWLWRFLFRTLCRRATTTTIRANF